MFFHLFERLRQMIVDGDLADMERIGNLTVFQPLLESQAENVLREFWQTRVYVIAESVEPFLPAVLVGIVFQVHDGGLLFLLVHQQIDAAVAHACQQKALQGFGFQLCLVPV